MDESESQSYADVQATYDRIADHFAETRKFAWPEVEEFLADKPTVPVGLDLGCGNGRHSEPLGEHAERVVGVDVSYRILETARERAAHRGFEVELAQADARELPLPDGTVGLAVYVAALHHLPTRAERIGSLDELARVLDADGRALVSTWSTTHEQFDREEGFDTTIDWELPNNESVPRFYHIYAPEELKQDIADSGLELVDFELSSGNCYAVVTKALSEE